MSIEALILGKLHKPAERRASSNGRAFVTAKITAAVREGESVFVNAIAFSETAGAALLALAPGDSVALAGALRPGAWIDREGNARASVDLVTAQVMTHYALTKKRKAAAAAAGGDDAADRGPAPAANRAANHTAGELDGGDDDEWLNGGAR